MAQALRLTGGEKAAEMSNFISLVDNFFDSVNVVSLLKGKHKRKVFQNPYRSGTDFRLKVCTLDSFVDTNVVSVYDNYYVAYYCSCVQFLEQEFLAYLDRWTTSVKRRAGYSDEERERMLLSQQTMKGLRITGALYYM